MPFDLLDRLMRRPPTDTLPVVEAPPVAAAVTPVNGSRLEVLRETIDLLEADLSAMIRGVEAAASVVHQGTQASSRALDAIRDRSESLARQSNDAKQDANQLATATEELA